MAIDGVKVIDSDDGHDIYHYVVEGYKDGESIDKIISGILERAFGWSKVLKVRKNKICFCIFRKDKFSVKK